MAEQQPPLHSVMLMKPPKVMDKRPNPIQITAEQLLIDAQFHIQREVKPPNQRIMDEEELKEYKFKKRQEFETKVRKDRFKITEWIRYATWEENLQEFQRSRSIYERALDIDYKHVALWLKYADMEMKHKFINHARNIWERACHQMPLQEHFWYKYAYMEEIIGNYKGARDVFERWMEWKPSEKAWLAFANFERRMRQSELARLVMYRFLEAYPRLDSYLKVAKFEIKMKHKEFARKIFEKAVEDLGEVALKEEYFLAFVYFELRNKEIDRVREIFKFALSVLNRENSQKLVEEFVNFEKQYGEKEEIDEIIFNKRRMQYLDILNKNPLIYDTWFDLINLEIAAAAQTRTFDKNKIIDAFERAIKNTPPGNEKRFWRRYIYIWYKYAIYTELELKDLEKAKEIYQRAISLVPHKQFTFNKLWVMFAHFYIRCKNLDQARKTFGKCIGLCPNEKIFKAYIDMELQLAEIERCRTLYEKWIELSNGSAEPWIKFAELEKSLEENDRFEAIMELAVQQQSINMPELVWKAYIDFYIADKNYEKVRELFARLMERSKHVKVWLSYAQFEASIENIDEARKILQNGENYLKENPELKEERVFLLESWLQIEQQFGTTEKYDEIQRKQPKKVKKQKKIKVQEGDQEEEVGWEEYYDYVFPDDPLQARNLKILQKAYNWKQKKVA